MQMSGVNTNKQNESMQRSKMSHFFKSKQPKIALYKDLERRMRESSEYTIGPDPNQGNTEAGNSTGGTGGRQTAG